MRHEQPRASPRPLPFPAMPWRRLLMTSCLLVAGVPGLGAQESPAASPTPAAESSGHSLGALGVGNRLFRDGQIDAAIEAYTKGYRPAAPNPTLAYNLGTSLHHAGRLPEAILWYRRSTGGEDPWLEDNLWLARRTLGSRSLPAGDFLGRLSPHKDRLRTLGIGIAWLSLLFPIFRKGLPTWSYALWVALACGCYGLGEITHRLGPRQGVFLEDCRAGGSEIPAGSEAWVRQGGDGSWRIAASPEAIHCPADSIQLVFPKG